MQLIAYKLGHQLQIDCILPHTDTPSARFNGTNMSLKHAILTLLETEQGSGYDLLKRFKERLGFFWNASHQQIYLQLKKMHAEGLIEFETQNQQGKPDRKVYHITSQGHEALMKWIESPIKISKVNDGLLVKLYAGHLVDISVIQKEIAEHKDMHTRMLNTFLEFENDFKALEEDQKKQYSLPYLTLRRGILGEQAWLQWAQEVEDYLV